MNLSDIVILNIEKSDYRCVIGLISKNEAINSNGKCWFDQKSGKL